MIWYIRRGNDTNGRWRDGTICVNKFKVYNNQRLNKWMIKTSSTGFGWRFKWITRWLSCQRICQWQVKIQDPIILEWDWTSAKVVNGVEDGITAGKSWLLNQKEDDRWPPPRRRKWECQDLKIGTDVTHAMATGFSRSKDIGDHLQTEQVAKRLEKIYFV